MGFDENMLRLREQIFSDLSWDIADSGKGLFGSSMFSPLTEVAVFVLRLHQRAQEVILSPEAFRAALLRLFLAEDAGDWAVGIWPPLPVDARLRLKALVAATTGLPEAFVHLILTQSEVESMARADAVTMLYRFYLGRVPDPQGLAHWSDLLEQRMTFAEVARELAGSDEARLNATGRSILVIEDQIEGMGRILSDHRRLQDQELNRLYDFARLVSFLDK